MKKKKPSKTLPKLKKELQIVFNQFIRLRDKNKPCISCGEFKELEAGHFYAVGGYDGLRFDQFNVHGECAYDNCFNESHLIGYSENLLERIGKLEFELLKQRARDYKMGGWKFSRTDLEAKIMKYKYLVNEMQNS